MPALLLLLLVLSVFLPSASVRAQAVTLDLEDGEYAIDVTLRGGSGKAFVNTPTLLLVQDAEAYARIVWSSSNYDYMLVDGIRYENEAEEEENSVFTIPVTVMDEPMEVIGDTLAMGTPHEIRYTLTFDSSSIDSKSALPQEAAKRVLLIAACMIIGGGILNAAVKRKLRE